MRWSLNSSGISVKNFSLWRIKASGFKQVSYLPTLLVFPGSLLGNHVYWEITSTGKSRLLGNHGFWEITSTGKSRLLLSFAPVKQVSCLFGPILAENANFQAENTQIKGKLQFLREIRERDKGIQLTQLTSMKYMAIPLH